MRAFQRAVIAWAIDMFGVETDTLRERAARHLEEASEAAQAAGVQRHTAHAIVDRVWSRPAGNVRTEIGQSALTLVMLAEAGEVDLDDCLFDAWEKARELASTQNGRQKLRDSRDRKVRLGISGDLV